MSTSVQIQGLRLIQQWWYFDVRWLPRSTAVPASSCSLRDSESEKPPQLWNRWKHFSGFWNFFRSGISSTVMAFRRRRRRRRTNTIGRWKNLRSDDLFWSRHYQALNVTMDQECQQVTFDKWGTKTFSYSLSSWDQILQQRWVGRLEHERDSCHELSAVLATLANCEENIEEKCGLPLTRKIINNLILRREDLFPGIGPIATKLRRAARLQLNSYQVWIRVWIYLIYLQLRK